ncbi:NAD-dependent epimerase/dehydratase family protein [Patescibacteria group bacterium]|nr:NAD-dependent epimerase/dehydratase family protein [Patescibacteria group bacterium]MBU2159094.1 NAD-dependent epimerase/dehydratase family protein [Patescibacteria group bacterium]MBU2220924.1 NAD-dependent epimerase/dehydratase family protein [Patescibacteria group bacterium]
MSKLIVVTGGAGFVGTHLCRKLQEQGHRVISLDNYFTGSRENHVSGVEYREGHTKDIEESIPESPDLVYHLGEYSRVEKSFEDIETVWDLNKTGTFAVLEFVRRRGAKIVYAGSSTKFAGEGSGKDQSPYAWTKATNTELVKNYAAWYGIPYAITYFYNVYGPGERAGAFGTVIEIYRQSFLKGRPLGVSLPGTQTRNFTHVSDIVDGLVRVGEHGEGDEYGIGDERAYAVKEVAELFGAQIVMLPERAGNRMSSIVDTTRVRALGWEPKTHLAEYIEGIRKEEAEEPKETRVLVFTTTFHPVAGPAEEALCTLMEKMPEVQFDIVTTLFSKSAVGAKSPISNATVHRVGWGSPLDKYLLPLLGARVARMLAKEHEYLFSWSVMASYGTLAALSVRRNGKVPLLVTLADQRIGWFERMFIRIFMRKSDQVYASFPDQTKKLASLKDRMSLRKSLGEGDAFANQVRFAYAQTLQAQYKRSV